MALHSPRGHPAMGMGRWKSRLLVRGVAAAENVWQTTRRDKAM